MAESVKIGGRTYHLPFVEEIPFEPKQREQLKASIEETGKVVVPILCWQEKHTPDEDTVIDGGNRCQIAAELELKDIKKIYKSFASEDDARAECHRLNFDRRQIGEKELKARREERAVRVAEARAAGESLRSIAESEGVSTATVLSDLEKAEEVVEPPEKVTGKDGRPQAAKKKPRGNKHEGNGKEAEPMDAHGNVIPKNLRDAYLDPWIQTAIDYLGPLVAAFWQERLASGLKKRIKRYPFMNLKDFEDGCAMAGNTLDDLLKHLKDNRPSGVCPMCSGKKCPDCLMSGLVPRELYKELKTKAREQRKAEKEAAREAK